MARKKNKKVNNLQSTKSMTSGSMKLGMQSAPSLSSVNGYIMEEARSELRFPNSIKLYKQMLLDPNVASAYAVIEMMLSRVEWEIVVPNDASKEEHRRSEILNYNMLAMRRSFQEYIVEFLSYIIFGFATPEKVYKKFEDTPVGDFVGWQDFKMLSQDTVGQWIMNNSSGELVGLRQDLSQIDRSGVMSFSDKKDTTLDLPRKKFMLFRHSPRRDNPEGISPLRSCYTSWKYRSIVEEYEAIGITKDLGGTPILEIDSAIISAANENPSGWEANLLDDMKAMAASIHAGEQNYGIIPKAYDANNNPLFSFRLLGIEGGGKQYDTDNIVRRHDTKILMTFFADVLKLGTDSHGSFSLADSKTSLLTMGVESHLKNIQRTLNHDLMKQTYELNGWEYDPRSSCSFKYGDIEQRDINDLSSALQRVAATGLLQPTSDVQDKLRKDWLDLPSMEVADPEILDTESTSRSGDGMVEGLNGGTGKAVSPDDNSKSNKENK